MMPRTAHSPPTLAGGAVLLSVAVVAALALVGCVTGTGGVLPSLADGGVDGSPLDDADSEFSDTDSGLPDGEVVADAALDTRRPDLERPPIDENLPERIETATFSLG